MVIEIDDVLVTMIAPDRGSRPPCDPAATEGGAADPRDVQAGSAAESAGARCVTIGGLCTVKFEMKCKRDPDNKPESTHAPVSFRKQRAPEQPKKATRDDPASENVRPRHPLQMKNADGEPHRMNYTIRHDSPSALKTFQPSAYLL
ncbi:hypothetical protein [Burkholderia lata]|uniref:hypothetical protein n=1 Tax=Burkholderia lata (strain ATCC 17760 / DSM 23089 / LMG 22485 / NCIMB 9086 / R18194 / 383) TaxID=482957 RepID=UPI001581B9E3|nr:hypothetical protein [Burkholderia lata]